MGAEDAFELAADAFDGRGGTVVAGVGVKADAERAHGFEGVGEHQQLGLGVGGGADGGGAEPGVSDLAYVWGGQAVARIAGGPSPVLDIEEAG